jgi:polyferredoxin
VLAREVEGGMVENVYRLQVMNVSERPHRYRLSVTGLEGIQLVGENVVAVEPAKTASFTYAVRVPPDAAPKGSHTIYFDVKAEDDAKIAVHEKTTFLMP